MQSWRGLEKKSQKWSDTYPRLLFESISYDLLFFLLAITTHIIIFRGSCNLKSLLEDCVEVRGEGDMGDINERDLEELLEGGGTLF